MKILYSHTSAPTYIRCLKNINALTEAGHSVYFFGALREGGPTFNADDFSDVKNLSVDMYPHKFPHGIHSVVHLLGFLILLRRKIKEIKPDVVVLTNEELVLATLLLKKRFRIALDAIDALDIRSDSLVRLRGTIKRFVDYARGKADLVVEVEEFRSAIRPQFASKTIVVRNTPTALSLGENPIKPIDNLAQSLPSKYIYASGSLNAEINGVETLIAAARGFEGLKVVIAGFIKDQTLLELIKRNADLVVFCGPLSHAQSMALGQQALAIFAHYKPVNQNFRLAAPNKVYEAFALARPLLINTEAVISKMCCDEGFGYASSYGDINGLKTQISAVLKARIDDSVGEKFNIHFSWGSEKRKLVTALESLAVDKC